MSDMGEGSQEDCEVGGSWDQIAPWTHWGNIFIYAKNSENNLKIQRIDLLQLILERRQQQKARRGPVRAGNQTFGGTKHSWEGHYKHGETRDSDPTPGTSGTGTHTGKMSAHLIWLWKPAEPNFGSFKNQWSLIVGELEGERKSSTYP